jgi:hypothetical protein
MSPNSDSYKRDQTSGAANLKIIDLEFETLRQFREVMASRLSYEGFFVATNDPLPKGTPARFRFLLPDGFVLVEGTAVVAWARSEAEEPDQKAGMALLFNELEHQSREIVDELIDYHIATGGDPFEIGPFVSEAGEIGTDALAVDPLETKVPLPETEPSPAGSKAKSSTSDEFLPDWLSEVAQKHDVDFSIDAAARVGRTGQDMRKPESPVPVQQDFDISLMPEEEEMDLTPAFADDGGMPEVTVPPPERQQVARGLRLRPLLAVAAVLVVVAVVVWWMANRGRVGRVVPEPAVVVDEIPAAEAPVEVVEETSASEPGIALVEEAPASGPAIDVVEERPEEPAGKPPEVAEKAPESAPGEEVMGPATRVLLVAATRIGDATVVTVRTNGELSQDTVKVSLLEDPARVWIRIAGIATFYRPNDIEVGSPEVERVRVGHHPEETPQSLYVVCDLEDPAAVVREYTVEGDTLRVVVGRP